MRIGLLSRLDALILGYVIKEFDKAHIPIDAVILDSKRTGDQLKKVREERTGGRLPLIPLEEFESLEIPFYFFRSHTAVEAVLLVRKLNLDLLVNAGTPRILTPELLSAPNVGVINCHPGLLPQFRGCTCVEWAVYLDERVGNTVHFMTDKVDEGPIVVQEGLSFEKNDDYVDVRVKTYRHAFMLLAKGVKMVLEDELTPDDDLPPQHSDGRYFKPIDSEKLEEVRRKLSNGEYVYQR